MSRIVYAHQYNIGFYGLENLHPFDSKKYGRIWKSLKRHYGRTRLKGMHVRPERPVTRDELRLVHSKDYLDQLRESNYVALALELPPLTRAPNWLIEWHILRPMRWATAGTIIAARECLDHGFAVNLSGGYHHAKPERGEGFCIYADAAIAVAQLRRERRLTEDDRVLYIDTDAHQGNGVCHAFRDDTRMFIFDIYNADIYPNFDTEAIARIDCDVPLNHGTRDDVYLEELRRQLTGFVESLADGAALAIYNAGTDIFENDPLGGLPISASAILERDLFVIEQLRHWNVPTVMLLSGGYTKQSHELVTRSLISIIGGDSPTR